METGGSWGGGAEAQYYTPLNRAGQANLSISGAQLVIQARREVFGSNQFTSGRVKTTYSQRYGRVQVRARMDSEQNGVWPAIWLIGPSTGVWPANGELDLMEWLGGSQPVPYSHLHSLPDYNLGFAHTGVDVTQWHVYEVEWRPEFIEFKVDGTRVGYTTPDLYGDGWNSFSNPQYLVLNVAINNTHPWMPTPDPGFVSATMTVDYVQWYP